MAHYRVTDLTAVKVTHLGVDPIIAVKVTHLGVVPTAGVNTSRLAAKAGLIREIIGIGKTVHLVVTVDVIIRLMAGDGIGLVHLMAGDAITRLLANGIMHITDRVMLVNVHFQDSRAIISAK